ncbi:MAG: S8 family serine peptidase, partial [Muribaculaceae bacterium]|nr:S8 family serine peptidase [Muribaculaceae bacterium]
MKNLLFCGLLAAGCCLSAGAQSKINGPGRHMIEDFKERAAVSRGLSAPQTMVITTLEKGVTASDIAALGYEVVSDFGDMLIVSLPLDKVEAFAELDEVYSVSFGTQSAPLLNVARAQTGVDAIQNGTGDGLNGVSYTGKGVVCGLYDTGLDPNHPAFKTPDGTSRVKGVYVLRGYTESNVQCTEYTTPQQIASFTTEDENESHGTHVLGIMAGTNGVKGNFGEVNATGGVTPVSGQTIPYYGSAIDADLVVGCGDFYDASILAGVDKVVNAAIAMGQPAVVNLSLGNNSGSHDENDSASKILDRLGQKAIICIAAGNEGLNNMAITKRMGGISGTALNTFFTSTGSQNAQLNYTAQFWSNNTDRFTCELVLYSPLEGKVVEKLTVGENGGSATFDSGNAAFAGAYDGTVRASGSIDRDANRYCVTVTGSYSRKSAGTGLYIGVNITAGADMAANRGKIDAYINTTRNYPTMTFSSENVAGYLNGSPNGSINGMGCGQNILSVGAYVSRTSWPLANGTMASWNTSGAVGEVASFSSYGTTNDDRSLPHCVAPGSQ